MPSERGDAAAERPGYSIAAVHTTLAVMAALARIGPASLTGLAAAAGCTRVKAFRVLHTLRDKGLATQDGKRGAWRLGVGWLAIARAARQHGALRLAVTPTMAALALDTGETVVFAVRDGEQSEVVAVEAPPGATRIFAIPGDRGYLHAGPGRLLLAYAPEDVLRSALANRLPRLGAATKIDPAWIIGDLSRIRLRQWLVTRDELGDGIFTISTAIREDGGEVIAVISIVCSTLRMRESRPQTLLPPLFAAARVLGRLLSPMD